MRIAKAQPGSQVDELFNAILAPSFPPEELCPLSALQSMAEGGAPILVAIDDDDRIIGGAIGEWDASLRVLLLSWLAIRPGIRGGGIGGALLKAATESWTSEYEPCIFLAEVEDPEQHQHGTEATGDPAARLRFYQSRGARALDIPYFQASLGPGLARVHGLLLMVLYTDPSFHGEQPDTIKTPVIRSWLESYQLQCEGAIGTDEQAMAIWNALDAVPGGIPLVIAA